MKSSLAKYVLFILAVLLGILGYCVFDYIDTNIYNGIYPVGKYICICSALVPYMIADIIKTKKITSLIFPVFFIGIICAWFVMTLPSISYEEESETLSKSYKNIITSTKCFDNDTITQEKIPSYYKGAYIYEGTKDDVNYFIVVNPKDGTVYEYEVDKNTSMSVYFAKR